MKYLIRIFSAFFLTLTLLTAAGCASSPKAEGTGEYVDDSVVTTKVKAALVNDPNVSAAEVNVETFKGVVQLSGFVKTRAEMNRAIEVARGVPGVKSVKNNMTLK
ncbi:MAG: BON domain-containing protein [Methylobacter sp.]